MIYIQLLISSILWGSNVVLMKLFLKDVSYIFLCFLRVLLSALSLFLFKTFKCENKTKINHMILIITGFIGIYLNFIFTMYGMKHTLGNQSALVNALIPVFTLIASYVFLHQKLNKLDLISIILCLLGFIISIVKFHKGIIYMLLGSMFYISSFIIMKKYKIKQTLTTLFYQMLYGLIFLMIHCFIIGEFDVSQLYTLSYIENILFIVISGIGFAYIQYTYIKSIDLIGLDQTSFYLSLNPIVTYIESIILFNEEIKFTSIIGMGLIIISIFIRNLKKRHLNA